MARLSYFTRHLCKNLGCAKAAPRRVERGVGWADVHVFVTKMKANSYKMFGKINFKLFRIRCFLFFIFHFSFCIVTIGSQINFFFNLFLTRGVGMEDCL